MDEAHHSPAVTWSEILNSFPNAKKLLVAESIARLVAFATSCREHATAC